MLLSSQISTIFFVRSTAVILVANEVQPCSLEACQAQFSKWGTCLQIVGNRAATIYDSEKGIIATNTYLGNLPHSNTPQVIVIPEGRECVLALLIDPRVHHFVRRVIAQRGLLIAPTTAELLMRQMGLITSENESFFMPLEQFYQI